MNINQSVALARAQGGEGVEQNTTDIPMVQLERVRKSYGAVNALVETDLSIRKSEFVTLLGPSGSGKTTILNLVAGMTGPTGGRIFIQGQDVTDLPPNKRELGMVFQHYALMPHMTIFENVAFPLRVRRVSQKEIKRRVGEALEMVRLPQIAKRKPSELSGGQQQRVAIARCLVYNPSIILMDEPLGALDKKLREEMQLELKRIHAELRITALYVTHDQEEALSMSDRIILMNGGRIEQMGPPNELYFRPKSVFAAKFLGDSNIFNGKVVDVGREISIETACGLLRCAAPSHNPSMGEQVSVLVRPENMSLHKGSATGQINRLDGHMMNSIAYGGLTKCFVTVRDGMRAVTQHLTRSDLATPSPQSEVSISFEPKDALVLPAVTAHGEPTKS